MDTLNRIKKNIKTLINMKGEKPEQIFITKKEAEELGIEEYDGVKLVILEEFKVQEDCFFYNSKSKDCNKFKEMFCKYKKCKFYKNEKELSRTEIEDSIKNYSIKKAMEG